MKNSVIAIACSFASFCLQGQSFENNNYIDSLSRKIGEIKLDIAKIQENYYVITPSGVAGNIGVYVGDSGVLLVDDQWAVLSKRIRNLIATISRKPIKVIINTHYHFDHTNGNLAFGPENVQIIAHQNARARMSDKQFMPSFFNVVQNPYPAAALPTTTFTDKLDLHDGKETIELLHFKSAHTDGDVVVHFRNADIYHMGDIFITYGLPHIDEAAGGDIFATIEAVENVISRATEGTKIIPGHGPVCSKKELLEYRKLLVSVRDNVVRLFKEKKSIDQIVKETIAKIGYENRGGEGFIEQVYRSVQRHEEKDNSAAK